MNPPASPKADMRKPCAECMTLYVHVAMIYNGTIKRIYLFHRNSLFDMLRLKEANRKS